MENLQELPEEVVGVAPEVVEKVLGKTTTKLVNEIEKVRDIVSVIRDITRSKFTINTAKEFKELCYAAVDSSYTAPAIELIGGYLGIVVVSTVLYGLKCSKCMVDAKAYTDLWFSNDLTSIYAKYYERLTTLKLLKMKEGGELYFDVLLVDGELIPRTSTTHLEKDILSKVIELTSKVIELADKTDTALVGILKRSYARDVTNILGFHDLRLNDRAIMSLILKPNEYLIVGAHCDIYDELRRLKGKLGVNEEWLNARLRWYEILIRNIPIGYAVKLAFYRAPKTLYPTATKVEYLTSNSLDEDALLSSLIHISTATGIPAPIDYADALSIVTRELKQTVYQKLLVEVAKKLRAEAKDILPILSLMNPEKITRILT
ncbi:MAG: DNA double-strand break repair nuclease NurA [Sulfolobales archaeon]